MPVKRIAIKGPSVPPSCQEPTKPPEGEWHRTEVSEMALREVVRRVYGPDALVGVAHHICVYGSDGKLVREWASVETLIFDHGVLRALFGERDNDWMPIAEDLVRKDPLERLVAVALWLKVRDRERKMVRKRGSSEKN